MGGLLSSVPYYINCVPLYCYSLKVLSFLFCFNYSFVNALIVSRMVGQYYVFHNVRIEDGHIVFWTPPQEEEAAERLPTKPFEFINRKERIFVHNISGSSDESPYKRYAVFKFDTTVPVLAAKSTSQTCEKPAPKFQPYLALDQNSMVTMQCFMTNN